MQKYITHIIQGKQYYIMQKGSTIDLHNIQDDIYLGYLGSEPLNPTSQSFDITYFGGEPTWLQAPKADSQICKNCRTSLAFLGQVYCPFQAEHTYHRILYFLFCDNCLRYFKCIRQQSTKQWKPSSQNITSNIRKCCEQAYEVFNDPLGKKDFIKMMNKAKQQIEQEKIIQQAPSEEQDQEQIMKQVSQQQKNIMDEVGDENDVKMPEKQEEQKFDINFEKYKKVMAQLDGPCMLYTDTPLPYNCQPLNHRHFCSACGSKLSLQVQITQKILLLDQNNKNSRLFLLDWGSLMLYTCSASCNQGSEQEIILQYEQDAIKDDEIKKLKKKNKNKKKSERKSLSKGKSEQKNGQQDKQEEKQSGKESDKQQTECIEKKDQEGDWD